MLLNMEYSYKHYSVLKSHYTIYWYEHPKCVLVPFLLVFTTGWSLSHVPPKGNAGWECL